MADCRTHMEAAQTDEDRLRIQREFAMGNVDVDQPPAPPAQPPK
jgi:hypothetical protein